MRIVEISPQKNGAHRNQDNAPFVPPGWALLPLDIDAPGFPIGDITVKDIGGIPTVTAWLARKGGGKGGGK